VCHVLIIEDEPLVAMDVEALLAENGGTSFAFAETEKDAVVAALVQRPEFIISDVSLTQGTGPAAVKKIHALVGDIPVIFVTATPQACVPCDPPGRIFEKPMHQAAVAQAFREMIAA
jgi:CheY-like chemotaxis protein